MRAVTNIVLYAVADGARSPLASFDAKDAFLGTKVSHHVGEKMRECRASGAVLPDFKLVRETREADEGGRVVVAAEFQELNPSTLAAVGAKCGRLDEVFAPPVAAVAAPKPDADTAKKTRSKELSK